MRIFAKAVTDEWIQSIADGLLVNSSVQDLHLILSDNDMLDTRPLSDALISGPSMALQCLTIQGPCALTQLSVEAIASAIGSTTCPLKKLKMRECMSSDGFVQILE